MKRILFLLTFVTFSFVVTIAGYGNDTGAGSVLEKENLYSKDMIDIQSFMWEIKILENKI